MSPRCPSLPSSSARVAITLLAVLGATTGAATADALAFRRRLNAHDEAAVERAKAGAARRLQDPACSRVLTDFNDRRGRTLEDNLEQWGKSAAEYVRSIPFLSGDAMPLCKKSRIELVTVPGMLPVFVCPAGVGHLNSRFASVQARNPALAESMVIHEMLHTLGLGENPPSSFEITARVRERCR